MSCKVQVDKKVIFLGMANEEGIQVRLHF